MKTDVLPTEDEVYRMTKMTELTLKETGYRHYEISNFARRGYECRHNIGYWERENYLGLGLGAASLMENIRYTNTRDLYAYLEGAAVIREGVWQSEIMDEQGKVAGIDELPATNLHASVERVPRKAQIEEYMFLGLRKIDGISRDAFERAFGIPVEAVYQEVFTHLTEQGLLLKRAGQIYLTEKGQDLSNYVLAQFLL